MILVCGQEMKDKYKKMEPAEYKKWLLLYINEYTRRGRHFKTDGDRMRRNIRIIHTQITPKIRVSTMGRWKDPDWEWGWPNGHYIYETRCFSDDPRQKSLRVLHGERENVCFYCIKKAINIHRHISNNLKKRYK